MIANIENTTKSVSGEKEKEAKQTSKNKESAEKRIDRFSELYAYARKHGVFVRSFLSFSSQKTDLFLLLRFYAFHCSCCTPRKTFVTEEDEDEVVAEEKLFSVRFLSKNTFAFFAFVKSEAHFGVKAAAAQETFSNFIRERERERENVGGGGEENDINEH